MPTEAKDIFEAHSRSLRELLSENGLGLYLPPYQRPYGWSRDKVEKLIDDTLHGLRNLGHMPDSFTFLGTVITIHDINHATVKPMVKTEVPAKVLTVIDGQQRLSTLLMLIISIHNQIRQTHWSVFKGKSPDPEDVALTSLHDESIVLLNSLAATFYEKQQIGDSPIYPRLIRAFKDQWAKKSKLRYYESPIAHLIFEYACSVDSEKDSIKRPTDFKPKPREGVEDGEQDLIKRLSETRRLLINLARGKEIENFESLPDISLLASNPEFQRALFNHPFEQEFCDWLDELQEGPPLNLVRLLMLGAYALHRIALTVVKGKDEDYAFTIFESLNTTGEPLTAFETFLPRVVMAEGLEEYQESNAQEYIASVQGHLSRFQAGDRLQNATRELLIAFALAETGKKLSKRLSDQRGYLKEEFEKHKDSKSEREAFLRHLRDTAKFTDSVWGQSDSQSSFEGLDTNALTDAGRLCLSFLAGLNHTVAIAPLVRFYSEALHAADANDRREKTKNFDEALKAITAFTILWRSSRMTTGNIDSEYRDIMIGSSLTGMSSLARQGPGSDAKGSSSSVDVDALKKELIDRLQDSKHGDLPNLATWVSRASSTPIYKVSKLIARFLLLAAYHDAVEDTHRPGLIGPGKQGVAPCLTSSGWGDESHLTIEHIAPQTRAHGWDISLYLEKDSIHRIGNLVLVPGDANSSLGGRPWEQKRVLYGALGAYSAEEARNILNEAGSNGLTFAQSTEELARMSTHLPHLRALYMRDEAWNESFIKSRADCILKLAYAQISPWLGLDWSESDDDVVVNSSVDFETESEFDFED